MTGHSQEGSRTGGIKVELAMHLVCEAAQLSAQEPLRWQPACIRSIARAETPHASGGSLALPAKVVMHGAAMHIDLVRHAWRLAAPVPAMAVQHQRPALRFGAGSAPSTPPGAGAAHAPGAAAAQADTPEPAQPATRVGGSPVALPSSSDVAVAEGASGSDAAMACAVHLDVHEAAAAHTVLHTEPAAGKHVARPAEPVLPEHQLWQATLSEGADARAAEVKLGNGASAAPAHAPPCGQTRATPAPMQAASAMAAPAMNGVGSSLGGEREHASSRKRGRELLRHPQPSKPTAARAQQAPAEQDKRSQAEPNLTQAADNGPPGAGPARAAAYDTQAFLDRLQAIECSTVHHNEALLAGAGLDGTPGRLGSRKMTCEQYVRHRDGKPQATAGDVTIFEVLQLPRSHEQLLVATVRISEMQARLVATSD